MSRSSRGFSEGDDNSAMETNSLPRSMYYRSNTYSAFSIDQRRQKKVQGNFSHRRQYSDENLWTPSRLWGMWPSSSSLHRKSSLTAISMPQLTPKQARNVKIHKDAFHVPHRRMTDRSIVFSKDDILHKGWLKKQGGPFRIWQRRYFVLVSEYMFYFQKEDDQKPLGFIPLRGNKVEKHPFNPDELGKYLFEIKPGSVDQGPLTTNHDTFLLWASSSNECDEWLQVIRRVMYGRRGGGIFGQSLSDTITHESTTSTRKIPLIVEQCVSYIRKHGMKEEGIFRLPGRSTLVKELQERYDLGEKPNLDDIEPDVHTVASLFKLYLRQLPEPVIPFDHYDNFYDAINLLKKSEEEGKSQLIRELALLPRPNHFLLKFLCEFLHDLQTHEKENRMSIMNLSTVFGPNIYRAEKEDANLMMETTTLSQKFMHLLISKHTEMFPSNNSIKFTPDEGSRPIPPPRSKGGNRHARAGNGNVSDMDLLKFIQSNNLSSRDSQEGVPEEPDPWEEQLIRFSSAENLEELEKLVNASFTRRSTNPEVRIRSVRKDSITDSVEETFESANQVVTNGSVDKSTNSSESTDSGEGRQPTCLSFNNPLVNITHGSGESMMKMIVPPPMGIDLTEGTPEHKRLSNHDENPPPGMVLLEEQVKSLKEQLENQRMEFEQKLKRLELKCGGLSIKLRNEERGRLAAEERNKQLVKQVNAFIEEYGPSD